MMLAEEEAVAACTMLRSVASSKREALSRQLKAELLSEGKLSLDKSGSELQEEALQLALLMRGQPPSEAARTELLQARATLGPLAIPPRPNHPIPQTPLSPPLPSSPPQLLQALRFRCHLHRPIVGAPTLGSEP